MKKLFFILSFLFCVNVFAQNKPVPIATNVANQSVVNAINFLGVLSPAKEYKTIFLAIDTDSVRNYVQVDNFVSPITVSWNATDSAWYFFSPDSEFTENKTLLFCNFGNTTDTDMIFYWFNTANASLYIKRADGIVQTCYLDIQVY